MKRNLILTILVAGLAIYTYFEFRKSQGEGSFAQDERAAFQLKSDAVDFLAVERAQESFEMVKDKEGFWQMTKPVVDETEEASVMSTLMSLTTQRMRLFHPEDEKAGAPDWSKFGLAPPAATFTLGVKGQRESLSVSTTSAYDGSYYVRKGDELFVGDAGFSHLLGRSTNSFRSRRLYREDKPVTRAEVEFENEKFAFVKKGDAWNFEAPPPYPVDVAKIESWVDRARDFKASELVKDNPTDEDKKQNLLIVPSVKIKLNNTVLIFGQDRATDIFLMTDQRPSIFKTSVSSVAQLRVPMRYFRDGKAPFRFPIENARVIEVRDEKATFVFKKTDTGWANAKGADASSTAVSFMQALGELEAREFPSAKKSGIASTQVLVKDESGQELLSLAWGDDFVARESYNAGTTLRYVRTNREKDLLGVSKDKILAMLNTVSPKKAEPKKTDGQ